MIIVNCSEEAGMDRIEKKTSIPMFASIIIAGRGRGCASSLNRVSVHGEVQDDSCPDCRFIASSIYITSVRRDCINSPFVSCLVRVLEDCESCQSHLILVSRASSTNAGITHWLMTENANSQTKPGPLRICMPNFS